MAVITPLVSRFQALRDYTGSLAWGSILHLSKSTLLVILQRIQIGHLEIVDTDGQVLHFGENGPTEASKSVALQIHNEMFWVRLLLFADMGFAESYMLGEFSSADLTAFFKLFILNRNHLSNGSTFTSSLSSGVAGLVRKTNGLNTARLNISAHYDISNTMFAAFLSPDMTYSCPIWLPTTDPRSATETLEQAQVRKLQFFIDAAHLKPTDRVLEIGTGWGSFAIEAARQTGCKVTTLTLSVEQKELAEQRIEDAGLSDKITVLLCDYREMKLPEEGPFDKFVSIEMLEAVGREYMLTYFECVNRLLKKEDGIAVFQCITMPESRYESYASSDDFIRRYIFPGGHLPTVSQLVSSLGAGSGGTLIVDNIANIGPHYAKTLRLWREAFLADFDVTIRPALLRDHNHQGNSRDLGKPEIDTFRRKWEYYFAYCEAGFLTKTLGDVIITAGREGAVEMCETVPM